MVGEIWGLFRAFPPEGAVVWRGAPHPVIMQCWYTAYSDESGAAQAAPFFSSFHIRAF